MSEQYDNTNSGFMMKQTRSTHPKAPQLSGKINVDGKDYQISGWTRETQKGEFLLSLKVEEPWVPAEEGQEPRKEGGSLPGIGNGSNVKTPGRTSIF